MGPHTIISAALSHFVAARPRLHVMGSGSALDLAGLRAAAPPPNMFLVDIDDTAVPAAELISRCRETVPEARVCVLSGRQNIESLRSCIAAGTDGYISKQSSIDELFTAIEAVAEGGSYVDPRMGAMLLLAETRRDPNDLSTREVDIVRLVADGLSNREISAALDLSEKTIKNHISRIFSKLNISGRAQIAAHAIRVGIA